MSDAPAPIISTVPQAGYLNPQRGQVQQGIHLEVAHPAKNRVIREVRIEETVQPRL